MSVLVVLVPLVGLTVVGLAVVLVVGLLAGRRTPPAPSEAAEAARRHGGIVHAMAWAAAAVLPSLVVGVVGTVVARATGGGDTYTSVVVATYAAMPALSFLGIHALGERTWPRPTGPVRRAALVPRGLTAPTWLVRVTAGWMTALTVTLLVCGLTADDGRRLTLGSSSASPYPGWWYGAPVALAVACAAAATWAVLRMIVRRPAVLDADPAYDAASRLLAAHRVLRGVQLFLALNLAAVLSFAAGATASVGLEGLGVTVAVIAVTIVLASVAIALVPAAAPTTASPPAWSPPGGAPVDPPAGPPDVHTAVEPTRP